MIFAGVLRSKAYLCCLTQFTVDQPKLTVNGSVLSDTPNVRYLVALYPNEKHVTSNPFPSLVLALPYTNIKGPPLIQSSKGRTLTFYVR